ncbi:hypothetical protein [Haloarcula sp. K1]|uniref:hypothetical protein n=1 Tax=Haloarcula sp. K1 TaxID=1622207 RepID=UPI0007BC717C|nr:hypothetical protein [Haloarcula sp. K1]KZX46311.1 hypothetical protein AV929_16200 [Haloarcula sp. K1]
MSTETLVSTQPATFQHSPSNGECNCPIHRNQTSPPFTAPLGLPFSNNVSIKPISQKKAEEVYEAHHGYMDGDLHPANLAHHGLYYQDLLGAITYRYPFFSKKKLYFNSDDELKPKPYTERDFEGLPDNIEPRARSLVSGVDGSSIDHTEVLSGDKFVEANRICIGERMPNLASCSLAQSQEFFVESSDCPAGIEYLITYVVANFEGSMIKALRGKGWTCIGWSEPSQAGNREHKTIRDQYKWVFACPVSKVYEQMGLSEWK